MVCGMDPQVIDFTVCDRMKKARQSAGLSQTELGQRLGIHKNSVSNWERDPQPSVAMLIAWAYFTGCPVDWLCGQDVEIVAPTAGFEPATHELYAQVVDLFSARNAPNDPEVAA